jgi:hypothetical protein
MPVPTLCRTDRSVLVLDEGSAGSSELRDALRAAASDPAWTSRTPLLIDLRAEVAGSRCEDVRVRIQVLSEMRQRFGSRWAILSGTHNVPASVARMFAALSEIESLDVGLFADEDEAIRWLTEP